ncbi:MAG: hypothetical protein IKI48_06575 [Prevotella sp.]|nr:hypothetical protein [Prevotella sp.]
MKNTIYPVRPESSPKVAPIKKKDIHESLQEANDLAEKMNEQMTALDTRFAAMQKAGVTSRLDARSVELFNTVLAQTNAMPKEVEKAVNKTMNKVIKQMDEKISEIKMLCIAITLFLNGIIAMIVFLLK